MDGKGSASLLKTTKVSEWSFDHGGYTTVAFGGLILLGCISAYVIAVARGNVDAFLPLISDAAGSPPQNGLFGTLICLGGMFGVTFMIIRYMIVLEKNREKSNLVTNINKLSLVVGIGSMLGITLITGYPVNFYRNREIWLSDVGLPHMVGGVMLFALGLVYIALQCVLTLFLKTKNQTTLLARIAILFICTASFVYHMITVPDNFKGISHKYYFNNTETEAMNVTNLLPYPPTMGASLKIPIDTSGSYVASAVTEWIFVIFFCIFFFTFFNEAQQYSLLIVVETHSTKEAEVIEDTKAEIRRLSLAVQNPVGILAQVDEKPAPEVRKFLRRDSTCQTINEGEEKVITPTKFKDNTNGVKKSYAKPTGKSPQKLAKIDVANGTKKLLTNAGSDSKLDKLLRDNKDNSKNGVGNDNSKRSVSKEKQEETPVRNGTKTEANEDLEREAQRMAIEKIDNVVKDAEERAAEILKSNQEGNGTVKVEEKPPSVCQY